MKARVLHLSEAATVAFHAVCRLAKMDTPATARKLADELGASGNHMSKIMRRLVAAGIVESSKGPRGGFSLSNSQKKHKTLYDVFVAIEGDGDCGGCIFENGKCERKKCIFGDVLKNANAQFSQYLKDAKLEKFSL